LFGGRYQTLLLVKETCGNSRSYRNGGKAAGVAAAVTFEFAQVVAELVESVCIWDSDRYRRGAGELPAAE